MTHLVTCVDESRVEMGDLGLDAEGYAALYMDLRCYCRVTPLQYYMLGATLLRGLAGRLKPKNCLDVVDKGFHLKAYPNRYQGILLELYTSALNSKIKECIVLAVVASSPRGMARLVKDASRLKGYRKVFIVTDERWARAREAAGILHRVHSRQGFKVHVLPKPCITHSFCDALARYAAITTWLKEARLRLAATHIPELLHTLVRVERIHKTLMEKIRSVLRDRLLEEL